MRHNDGGDSDKHLGYKDGRESLTNQQRRDFRHIPALLRSFPRGRPIPKGVSNFLTQRGYRLTWPLGAPNTVFQDLAQQADAPNADPESPVTPALDQSILVDLRQSHLHVATLLPFQEVEPQVSYFEWFLHEADNITPQAGPVAVEPKPPPQPKPPDDLDLDPTTPQSGPVAADLPQRPALLLGDGSRAFPVPNYAHNSRRRIQPLVRVADTYPEPEPEPTPQAGPVAAELDAPLDLGVLEPLDASCLPYDGGLHDPWCDGTISPTGPVTGQASRHWSLGKALPDPPIPIDPDTIKECPWLTKKKKKKARPRRRRPPRHSKKKKTKRRHRRRKRKKK